ncbi:hypothetical protein N658DRAFT_331282 [Parathielavia hyrcaniae]|uniref:Uncharacterized protein n=1 Tax=Parathielavia hyrcaniae TaxID=113614 RepID=A0AAN6Q3S1_9PEZI|nr:hypothetical protein N658DRAFT_331282 [Parathielavia hyrcaniae]
MQRWPTSSELGQIVLFPTAVVTWFWFGVDRLERHERLLFGRSLITDYMLSDIAPKTSAPFSFAMVARPRISLLATESYSTVSIPCKQYRLPIGRLSQYPQGGRSTWRRISVSRLCSRRELYSFRNSLWIGDRFHPFGLGKYATPHPHVLPSTIP